MSKPSISSRGGRRTSLNLPIKKKYLLLCEGLKTECTYFEALYDDLRSSIGETIAMSIEVIPCGSQDKIVPILKKRRKKGQLEGFNKIFCIFDKESHLPQDTQRFKKILAGIKKEGVTPIVSVPSFEVWVLCHFEAPSTAFKNADDVITYLRKKHLPHYDKSDESLYKKLKNNTEIACTHAEKTWKGEAYHNPSTAVYDVVQECISLSNT